MAEDLSLWGPLAGLAGTWQGDKGHDTAPGEDRGEAEPNLFKERITLIPHAPVRNHEQVLYGLRYATVAYKAATGEAFHEENGYWLWDPAVKQVFRAFVVPRGITILAAGSAEPDARSFFLTAELGAETNGIASNPFLDREFRTVRYELQVDVVDENTFSYAEDTQIKIPGQKEIFHHRDRNTLHRVG